MIPLAIVEDSRATREGLEAIIQLSEDFRCVGSCDTGEKALVMLPKWKPEVVLMDIQLPGISGIECVARMKKQLPETHFIMVTVYEDPDRIFSALRYGASGYLLKRSAPEQILAAIREVQQGGAPMSAEIARKVILHFRDQTMVVEDLDKLTQREREVLELVANGWINKEIADRLAVSVEAVRWHLKHIYAKLQVRSRTEAALKYRGSA